MGVDHRRRDVLVTEQLLDGADILPILEEVSGEGMPKGVTRHSLGEAKLLDGPSHGLLQGGRVDVVSAPLSRFPVLEDTAPWKDPLPAPISGRRPEFAGQRSG